MSAKLIVVVAFMSFYQKSAVQMETVVPLADTSAICREIQIQQYKKI